MICFNQMFVQPLLLDLIGNLTYINIKVYSLTYWCPFSAHFVSMRMYRRWERSSVHMKEIYSSMGRVAAVATAALAGCWRAAGWRRRRRQRRFSGGCPIRRRPRPSPPSHRVLLPPELAAAEAAGAGSGGNHDLVLGVRGGARAPVAAGADARARARLPGGPGPQAASGFAGAAHGNG